MVWAQHLSLQIQFIKTYKIMINFKIDHEKCIKCKLCVSECPVLIINGRTDFPEIKDGKEDNCIKCQHCLAVCPTAALSIWDKNPEDSTPVNDQIPSSEALGQLYQTRRSTRRFKKEALDPVLINKILSTAANAPTSKNENSVLYTVVEDQENLGKLRSLTYDYIKTINEEGKLPKHLAFLGNFQGVWESKGIDVLFRNAPHLLITSAPKNATNPTTDGCIALSYFEILANTYGIGTLWNGFAKWTLTELGPDIKKLINIPEDHVIAEVMLFGLPAVEYARGIQTDGLNLNVVKL